MNLVAIISIIKDNYKLRVRGPSFYSVIKFLPKDKR